MSDTIAAISTAIGEGGIGIVRMSGDCAVAIVNKIFVSAAHGNTVAIENRRMKYGHIISSSPAQIVDEVLVCYMQNPHSYTGEDVVEIQCHGSVVSLGNILSLCYENGARPAEPGEFTKRAFLNGRLDLAQAGAVSDLIRAKTDRSYAAARDQLSGRLSKQVAAIRQDLLSILAESVARIDYPEAFTGEPEDEQSAQGYFHRLSSIEMKIESLIATAGTGRMIRDGMRIALIGKPNSGKSSLLNAMTGQQTSIVTKQPGTTRDAIEVYLSIEGLPVIMTDTAGIREAENEVERMGIDRSLSSYDKADIAFFIIDGSRKLSFEDRQIVSLLDESKPLIVLVNKCDLPQDVSHTEVGELLGSIATPVVISVSAMTETGLAEVRESIKDFVYSGKAVAEDSLLITNERHRYLLCEAQREVREAAAVLDGGDAPEFAEINIREAYDRLGEIIGETVTDDIIDRVFEDFCIGK